MPPFSTFKFRITPVLTAGVLAALLVCCRVRPKRPRPIHVLPRALNFFVADEI